MGFCSAAEHCKALFSRAQFSKAQFSRVLFSKTQFSRRTGQSRRRSHGRGNRELFFQWYGMGLVLDGMGVNFGSMGVDFNDRGGGFGTGRLRVRPRFFAFQRFGMVLAWFLGDFGRLGLSACLLGIGQIR